MRGTTFKAGAAETRGRKRVYSKRSVLKMDNTRKRLIKSVGGEREVHWKEIMKQARVTKAHPTTTADICLHWTSQLFGATCAAQLSRQVLQKHEVASVSTPSVRF